jgi:hypothetical protein
MRQIFRLTLVPLIAIGAVACRGNDAKVDDALNNDLSLAAQARSGLDTITAAERAAALAPAAAAPAPVRRVRRASSGSGSSSSGTTTRSAPRPIDRVVKHPGRDAAIGAGAGAIIGAATSKDKVKGGLIGAAAGGILGAVIGNNVDKKKVPVN